MLKYYAHIVQEDSLVLNHYKTILRAFIKCKVNVIYINNFLNKLIVRLIPLESFELKEVRPKWLKEL